MNCYLKLSSKFSTASCEKIKSCLEDEVRSSHCEVQQRAVEYLTFGRILNADIRKEITKNVPVPKVDREFVDNKSISTEEDEEDEDINHEEKKLIIKYTKGGNSNLITSSALNVVNSNPTPMTSNTLNLLDIFGSSGLNLDLISNNNSNNNIPIMIPQISNLTVTENNVNKNSNDIMSNLLGAYGTNTNLDLNIPKSSINNDSNKGLIDLTSSYNTNPSPNLFDLDISSGFSSDNTIGNTGNSNKEVYRNSEISISHTYTKNSDCSFTGSFYVSNLTPYAINNVNLKFMVLKFVTLKVLATSGTHLEPSQNMGVKKVTFKILFIF
jgi:hypothetical protein